MSRDEREARLDDRAVDQDLNRMRDAAAHLIDVTRRLVRAELDAGAHPVDALGHGLTMLQYWESGVNLDAAFSADSYAAVIEAILTPLHARVGAERMWRWLLTPNPNLYSSTPLRALASHSTRAVAVAATDMPTLPDVVAAPGADPGVHSTPRVSAEQYRQLTETRIITTPRLGDGRILLGEDPDTATDFELVFGPAHARAAAGLGIRVPVATQ